MESLSQAGRKGKEPNNIWDKHINKIVNMGYNRNLKRDRYNTPENTDVRQRALKQHLKQITKIHNIMATQLGAKASPEMKALEAKHKAKKVNPKHRVTPHLTPRGKDILMRLQNKSIQTDGERSYTQDPEIVNARFMNKQELMAAAKQNNAKVDKLKTELETKSKSPVKPKDNGEPSK